MMMLTWFASMTLASPTVPPAAFFKADFACDTTWMQVYRRFDYSNRSYGRWSAVVL